MFLVSFIASLLITDPLIEKYEKGSIKNTVKNTHFWLIYFSKFLAVSTSVMFISHLASYISDFGYSFSISAYFVTFFSIANTISRLVSGIIAKRLGVLKFLSFIMSMQTFVMGIIYFISHSTVALFLCTFIIGWSLGSMAVLFPSLTRMLFGKRNNTVNYGLIVSSASLAGIIGPNLGGWMRDITGRYLESFITGALFSICAAAALIYLREKENSIAIKTVK